MVVQRHTLSGTPPFDAGRKTCRRAALHVVLDSAPASAGAVHGEVRKRRTLNLLQLANAGHGPLADDLLYANLARHN